MRIETDGLDVSIKKEFDGEYLNLSHETEKIDLQFKMTETGLEHTAEQFISALFWHDKDLAHRLYEQFGNVANLKEEVEELKDKLRELHEDGIG